MLDLVVSKLGLILIVFRLPKRPEFGIRGLELKGHGSEVIRLPIFCLIYIHFETAR